MNISIAYRSVYHLGQLIQRKEVIDYDHFNSAPKLQLTDIGDFLMKKNPQKLEAAEASVTYKP